MSEPRRLRVDWSSCDGHGLCAQWAPELIRLDEWGYPVLSDDGAVPRDVEPHARSAVEACPVRALRLLPRR